MLHDNDDEDEEELNEDKENHESASALLIDIDNEADLNAVQRANAMNNIRRDSQRSIDVIVSERKSSIVTNSSDLDLDAEVERNLICQVIKDSTESNIDQDLFGSRPFDSSTVNQMTSAQQQKALNRKNSLNYHGNHVDHDQNLNKRDDVMSNDAAVNGNGNQDLFGAPPFEAAAGANPQVPPKQTQQPLRPPVPPKSDRIVAMTGVQASPAAAPIPILPPITLRKKRSTSSPPNMQQAATRPSVPVESIIDSENPPLVAPQPRKVSADVTCVSTAVDNSTELDAISTKSLTKHDHKKDKKLKSVTSKISKAYKVDHLEAGDDDDFEGLVADEDDADESVRGLTAKAVLGSKKDKDKSKDKKEKKEKKEKSKDKARVVKSRQTAL